MTMHHIVLDTNVVIAGLRSRRGASFRLLSVLGTRADLQIHVSVPLVLEYEATATAQMSELGMTVGDIGTFLDYVCSIAEQHDIYYLWRPFLRDPGDDMLLELAVAANCKTIVTYNTADLAGVEQFGIRRETAREFLMRIGELK